MVVVVETTETVRPVCATLMCPPPLPLPVLVPQPVLRQALEPPSAGTANSAVCGAVWAWRHCSAAACEQAS